MDFEFGIHTWILSGKQCLLFGVGLAFLLTYISIPSIVRVAQTKGLYAQMNGRSSHKHETPVLGGLAIFIGLIISMVLFTGAGEARELKYIIAALLILFFTGMKDDVLVIAPMKKLGAQIIAALLVVGMGGIRITSFQGFLGIYEMPVWMSIPFTIFVIIVLINGFNLIDGIDGLASGIGILVSTTFAVWFCLGGYSEYAVISAALVGALIAFFYFNVWGGPGGRSKIFLGDTGSMLIGFVVAVLAIRFLELTRVAHIEAMVDSTPSVAIGILVVPLFDTLRVMVLRIYRGQSPFQADRRHVHHMLLDLGFSHLRATATLLAVNALFVGIVYFFQYLGDLRLLIIIILLAAILSAVPYLFLLRRRKTS